MINDVEMNYRRKLMKPALEVGEEISIEGLKLFVNFLNELIKLRENNTSSFV